jgi:hypothetical protein
LANGAGAFGGYAAFGRGDSNDFGQCGIGLSVLATEYGIGEEDGGKPEVTRADTMAGLGLTVLYGVVAEKDSTGTGMPSVEDAGTLFAIFNEGPDRASTQVWEKRRMVISVEKSVG